MIQGESVKRSKRNIDATRAHVKRNLELFLRPTRVKDFAEELKELRKRAGLDQKDVPSALSERGVKVGERSYQGYETGENEPKSERKKAAILRELRLLAEARERESITPNAIGSQPAVVIWNPETNEVWVTIELVSRLVVHNPINLAGGKPPARGAKDGEGYVL